MPADLFTGDGSPVTELEIMKGDLTVILHELIAGETDAEAGSVSFRFRNGSQRNGVPIDEAVAFVRDWAQSRRNDDPKAEADGE